MVKSQEKIKAENCDTTNKHVYPLNCGDSPLNFVVNDHKTTLNGKKLKAIKFKKSYVAFIDSLMLNANVRYFFCFFITNV